MKFIKIQPQSIELIWPLVKDLVQKPTQIMISVLLSLQEQREKESDDKRDSWDLYFFERQEQKYLIRSKFKKESLYLQGKCLDNVMGYSSEDFSFGDRIIIKVN